MLMMVKRRSHAHSSLMKKGGQRPPFYSFIQLGFRPGSIQNAEEMHGDDRDDRNAQQPQHDVSKHGLSSPS
jgi:ribosomal protein L15